MPGRPRRTVPHFGKHPHREHRSDGTRNNQHHWRRRRRIQLQKKRQKAKDRDLAREIRRIMGPK